MARRIRPECTCKHRMGVKVGGVWQVGGEKYSVSDDCKYHAGMSIWAADEFDEITEYPY